MDSFPRIREMEIYHLGSWMRNCPQNTPGPSWPWIFGGSSQWPVPFLFGCQLAGRGAGKPRNSCPLCSKQGRAPATAPSATLLGILGFPRKWCHPWNRDSQGLFWAACRTRVKPQIPLLDRQLCEECVCAGSRHVPAPANTPSLPEGEAAEPGRCGTARDGSEVAGAKPQHMPGPVPQISTGREETEQGAELEVRTSSAAAVISAGRGSSTNEPLCSQQGAGNISP